MASSAKAIATTDEHLPEDVTLQILYRMTVKPLIRFSSTSKRWRSVISDPQFAKTHFKFSSDRNTLTPRLLLSTPSQMQSLDVQTPSFLDDSTITNLTCPFKQPGRSFRMLGSCNGMVFVALDNHDAYYIWNPTTGMFLKLPNPGFVSEAASGKFNPPKKLVCLHQYGFGYVSATNDYKVTVSALFGDDSMPLEIFSYRANSWKMMARPAGYLDYVDSDSKGVLLNEKLHWFTQDDDLNMPAIIAFDLATEQFQNVLLPSIGENEDSKIDFFGDVGVVFGGCLCVYSFDLEGDFTPVQLWVMMEYGVQQSWTKLFQFSIANSIDRHVFHTDSTIVVCRRKPGNLLNQGEADELIRFNLLDKDVADSSGRYTADLADCDMIKYDETLLWLDDHHGVEENVKILGTRQGSQQARRFT